MKPNKKGIFTDYSEIIKINNDDEGIIIRIRLAQYKNKWHWGLTIRIEKDIFFFNFFPIILNNKEKTKDEAITTALNFIRKLNVPRSKKQTITNLLNKYNAGTNN